MSMNRSFLLFALCIVPFAFLVSGCRQDMHDNPRYEAYEDGSIRQIPEGTVARGSLAMNPAAPKTVTGAPAAPAATQTPGPTTGQTPGQAGAGATATAGPSAAAAVPTGEDGFPFEVTREVLDRGQGRYQISCLPCHGKLGFGDGMIVQRGFRRAASYHQDRLRKAPASYFYDVMTNGFGAMSSYADQLTPEDRWKVAAYIRVLQLSQNAVVAELPETDRKSLEESERRSKGEPKASPSGGHNR
jgi:mono/diheme cytochrome c family protein